MLLIMFSQEGQQNPLWAIPRVLRTQINQIFFPRTGLLVFPLSYFLGWEQWQGSGSGLHTFFPQDPRFNLYIKGYSFHAFTYSDKPDIFPEQFFFFSLLYLRFIQSIVDPDPVYLNFTSRIRFGASEQLGILESKILNSKILQKDVKEIRKY